MKKKFVRRQILIQPKFQIAFLLFMLAITLFIIAEVYIANCYFFSKFNQIGEKLHLSADNIFFQFLQEQKSMMNWTFVVLSVVVLTTLMIFGLIFSHRIAGPIYRLKKHLTDTGGSVGFKKLKFRNGDFFQELADTYNDHISKK